MTDKFSFELPYKNQTIDYLESLYWDARNALNAVTMGGYEEYLAISHMGEDGAYPYLDKDGGLRRMIRFDDAVSDFIGVVDFIIGRKDDKDAITIRNRGLNIIKPVDLEDLPDAVRCWYRYASTFLDGAEFACKQQELWGAEMARTH